MMSANPHSGIHEAQVAKTLDTTVPTPQKAQAGQGLLLHGGDKHDTKGLNIQKRSFDSEKRTKNLREPLAGREV